MSSDFPQFKRSVGVSPGPIAQVGGGLDELASKLDKFSSLVSKERLSSLEQEDKAKAQELGSKLGFKPGANITDRQRAFNVAALQANKFATGIDIRDNINNLKRTLGSPENLNSTTLGTFQKQVAAYTGSLLSQLPAENKQYAKNVINYYATGAQNVLASKVDIRQTAKLNDEATQGINKFIGDSVQASLHGDTASGAALIGQASQLANLAVAGGVFDPDEAKFMLKNAKIESVSGALFGDFKQSLDEGTAEKFLQKFDKSKIDLNPADKTTLKLKMVGAMQEAQTLNKLDGQLLDHDINTTSDQVLQGDNSQVPATLAKLAKFSPERAQKMSNTFDLLKMYRVANQQMKSLPLEEKIQSMNDTLSGLDTGRFNAVGVQSHLTVMIKNQEAELKSDPAAYTNNSPAVQKSIQHRRLTGKGNPWEVMLNTQRGLGVAEDKLSLISTPIASQEAAAIEKLPTPLKRGEAIVNTISQYGPNSDIAMRDLRNAGLLSANDHMVNALTNPNGRAFVDVIDQAYSSNIKDLHDAYVKTNPKSTPAKLNQLVNGSMKGFLDTLTAYNGPATAAINDYANAAQRIALVYAQTESPEKAAEDASNAVANSYFDYYTQGENQVRFPKGMDSDLISGAMLVGHENAVKQDLKVPPYYPADVSPAVNEKQYKQDLRTGGHWVTLQNQKGAILLNSSKAPVRDADGNNVTFMWSDLSNPDSEIMKQITESSFQSGFGQAGVRLTSPPGSL